MAVIQTLEDYYSCEAWIKYSCENQRGWEVPKDRWNSSFTSCAPELKFQTIPFLCGWTNPWHYWEKLGILQSTSSGQSNRSGGCRTVTLIIWSGGCPWFPLQLVLLLLLHFTDEAPQEIQRDAIILPRSPSLGSESNSVQLSLALLCSVWETRRWIGLSPNPQELSRLEK